MKWQLRSWRSVDVGRGPAHVAWAQQDKSNMEVRIFPPFAQTSRHFEQLETAASLEDNSCWNGGSESQTHKSPLLRKCQTAWTRYVALFWWFFFPFLLSFFFCTFGATETSGWAGFWVTFLVGKWGWYLTTLWERGQEEQQHYIYSTCSRPNIPLCPLPKMTAKIVRLFRHYFFLSFVQNFLFVPYLTAKVGQWIFRKKNSVCRHWHKWLARGAIKHRGKQKHRFCFCFYWS